MRPFPSYLAPSPLPGAPKRSIANDLSLTSSVGGQAQGFGIRKTWLLGVPAVQRDSGFDAADLFPKAILTTDFVHTKAVLSLYKMKSESKCFFSALLIAQIPI